MVVENGDPAEPILRHLSKAGYDTYYLPLAIAASGSVVTNEVKEGTPMATLMAEDQMAHLDGVHEPCTHHYKIEQAPVGDNYPARCKWCGYERTFPVEPSVKTSWDKTKKG